MKLIRRLLPRLAPYRLRFLVAAAAMSVVAITNGAGVYLLKPIVDRLFVSKDPEMLKWVLIVRRILQELIYGDHRPSI